MEGDMSFMAMFACILSPLIAIFLVLPLPPLWQKFDCAKRSLLSWLWTAKVEVTSLYLFQICGV